VLPRATVAAAAAASLVPVLLVFTISTFPGEWLYEQRNSLPIIRNLHQLLFAGTPNEVTGRPSSWFSNRLVLTDQSFVDPDKFDKVDVSHSFRGRDLSYAVLSRADLRKADFTGATLSNAALSSAHLQNARFGCASTGNERQETGCAVLRGADLKSAQLQGANLTRAELQKADLEGAQVQGAVLKFARLEGALLRSAQLQDSDLGEANLQDAVLTEAQLQRARLGGAMLKSSNLVRAILQGADAGGVQLQSAALVQAQFQGANLGGARLQGADLTNSNLEGADLTLAELQGVNFLQASLKGANLEAAQLQGANLKMAQLQGAHLRGAKLQGANLSRAQMQGASLKEAFAWRAWVDIDEGHPALPDINLIDPDKLDLKTSPWIYGENKQAFNEWRDLILKSVPEGQNRNELGARISALDPEKEPEGIIEGTYWKSEFTSSADPQINLATFLTDLVCSSSGPDVARGLLRNGRILATGAQITVFAKALQSRKADPTDCPGVTGLTQQDWAALTLMLNVRKTATGTK
jgi:uncharacterized protein YjbI with pentapeptide repeats